MTKPNGAILLNVMRAVITEDIAFLDGVLAMK